MFFMITCFQKNWSVQTGLKVQKLPLQLLCHIFLTIYHNLTFLVLNITSFIVMTSHPVLMGKCMSYNINLLVNNLVNHMIFNLYSHSLQEHRFGLKVGRNTWVGWTVYYNMVNFVNNPRVVKKLFNFSCF